VIVRRDRPGSESSDRIGLFFEADLWFKFDGNWPDIRAMAAGEEQQRWAQLRHLWRDAPIALRWLFVVGPVVLIAIAASVMIFSTSTLYRQSLPIGLPRITDLTDNNFVDGNFPITRAENGLSGLSAKEKMDALGHAVALLPQGQIILLAPKVMTVGDKQKLEARVGLNVSFDQIAKSISSARNVEQGTLHVSPEMIATLDGAGFKITPLTPEKQSIGQGLTTAWSWTVDAEQEGDRELTATLYALVTMPGSEVRQRIDSYAQNIHVAVRARTFGEWLEYLSKQAKSLNGLVVAGVGIATAFGISLHWRRKGQSVSKEDAPSPLS
jgi:hypothetical protein